MTATWSPSYHGSAALASLGRMFPHTAGTGPCPGSRHKSPPALEVIGCRLRLHPRDVSAPRSPRQGRRLTFRLAENHRYPKRSARACLLTRLPSAPLARKHRK